MPPLNKQKTSARFRRRVDWLVNFDRGGGGNMCNTWPGKKRHAMHQSEHECWNAKYYPGTRQLCSECDQPTGRCEDDTLWSKAEEPLCEECWKMENP